MVGVFDSDFRQLFPDGRPIKAIISESSKAMGHPVESGATITDHIVSQPTEIELSLILQGAEFADVYQQIRAVYDRRDLVTVQTAVGSYPDMVIEGLPHDEVPEVSGAVALALQLRQVVLIETQFQALPPSEVRNPSDASTVDRGQQSGRAEGATSDGSTRSSLLYRTFYGGDDDG